jgi:hypothetical protein
MAGYLDHYGEIEERREKITKILVIALVALVVADGVGGTLFFLFHNHREESRVREFFNDLASHDYKGAYALFGCTDAKPCRDYTIDQFMEDWGPASGRSDPSNLRISRSYSCGSGVILTVDFGKNQQERLWVERKDSSVGFPPVAVCPDAHRPFWQWPLWPFWAF